MKASAKKEAPKKKEFDQIIRALREKGSSNPVKAEPTSAKSKKSAVKESAQKRKK